MTVPIQSLMLIDDNEADTFLTRLMIEESGSNRTSTFTCGTLSSSGTSGGRLTGAAVAFDLLRSTAC